MSARYVLYIVLLVAMSTSLFLYGALEETKTSLERRERELMRLKAELSRRKAQIEELRSRIRREGIKPLSEREALEVLFNFLDKLKGNYRMSVMRDVRKEGSAWVVDLKLSFEPRSGREIASRLKELTTYSSPIVEIKGVMIVTQPEPAVEMEVSLKQPFLEVER